MSICLSILWLVARGGCDTYAQCDEKAFFSAHSYIYMLNDQPLRQHHPPPTKIHLKLTKKRKQKRKRKNSFQPTPLTIKPHLTTAQTSPEIKSIHPSISQLLPPPRTLPPLLHRLHHLQLLLRRLLRIPRKPNQSILHTRRNMRTFIIKNSTIMHSSSTMDSAPEDFHTKPSATSIVVVVVGFVKGGFGSFRCCCCCCCC